MPALVRFHPQGPIARLEDTRVDRVTRSPGRDQVPDFKAPGLQIAMSMVRRTDPNYLSQMGMPISARHCQRTRSLEEAILIFHHPVCQFLESFQLTRLGRLQARDANDDWHASDSES